MPANPPTNPLAPIDAVNDASGQNHRQFNARENECSIDFLEVLLENITLLPQYLVRFLELGTCLLCQQQYQQVTIIGQNFL